MINPALDIWVWTCCVVLLALMGARAWVVETGRVRLGRTPVKVRVLTGGVLVSLVALVGLLLMQGGALFVDSVVNGTDPAAVYYGTHDDTAGGDAAADPGAADPAPADPAAPADPGAQPPAGQPPAGQAPAPRAPGR
jgi:hypothetical protein